MMGVGKSRVGRLLAGRLGWPYVDNDDALLTATGSTARELLRRGGTRALRDGESRALDVTLKGSAPAVVGVAAGTVLDAELRRRLRSAGTVVWLRASVATLVRRTTVDRGDGTGAHRPPLEGSDDVASWFARESAARAPLYEEVAHVTVDVDRADGSDRTPAEIVDDLVPALRPSPATG